jgi:thiamine-monophosphate kinase
MASDDKLSAEDRLIAEYFKPIATHPGALALTDDAAFITPAPGTDVVLKTDAIIGGVHFFAEDDARDVARKALRVNLSDLAAKGATPLGFLLVLALPGESSPGWLEAFARGLGEDAQAFGCPLIGGDTVSTPGPLTISITAFGSVAPGAMPVRTQARPGDRLYVSGTIGDAALGLALRKGAAPALAPAQRAHLLDRYLLPQPRLGLTAALRFAHAAMDVSDGLVGDCAKMLRASGVGGEIDLRATPFSDAARTWIAAQPAAIEIAATGGDDYEVLAAVAPDAALDF